MNGQAHAISKGGPMNERPEDRPEVQTSHRTDDRTDDRTSGQLGGRPSAGPQTHGIGELVYEYTARTQFIDFGVKLEDVLTGRAPLPPGGLRVDIPFEGEVHGRLGGYVKGCDYLEVRADGRMELNIRAIVTTPTGARIALTAGGVGLPQPGSTASLLREHVELYSADPEYAWVNGLEIWAVGHADVGTRQVTLRGYVPR